MNCHIVEGSSPIQECLEFSWSTNLPAWTYVHLLEEHDTRSMEASWKCLCGSTSTSLPSYPCQIYTVYRTSILRKRPTSNRDGLICRSVAPLIYSETWSSQYIIEKVEYFLWHCFSSTLSTHVSFGNFSSCYFHVNRLIYYCLYGLNTQEASACITSLIKFVCEVVFHAMQSFLCIYIWGCDLPP